MKGSTKRSNAAKDCKIQLGVCIYKGFSKIC